MQIMLLQQCDFFSAFRLADSYLLPVAAAAAAAAAATSWPFFPAHAPSQVLFPASQRLQSCYVYVIIQLYFFA